MMQNEKKFFWLGLATYTALATLAAVFYTERTAYSDIAFHLFYILKDGSLAIQNFRFGAVFTQLFPLLASKAGLPLAQVMLAYSVGFVAYYAAIFFLCLRLSRPHAIMLLLYNVLMVSDTFYWIQSEYSQGVAFLILWWAIVARYERAGKMPPWVLGGSFAMLLFAAFFHPLLAIVFVFLSGFHWLHRDFSLHKNLIASGVVAFGVFLMVKVLFFKNQYDADAANRLHNFSKLFPHYWKLASNSKFAHSVISDFYLLPVLLAMITFVYARQKEGTKLLLTLVFFSGYLLLVNVSYPDGAERSYMENLYLPLSIFLLVPFVLDVLPTWSMPRSLGVVGLILFIRIVHIGLSHTPYTDRIEWERAFLVKTGNEGMDKVILPNSVAPASISGLTWSTAYEFWLLSTTETGHTRSVLIDPDPSSLQWTTGKSRVFVTRWGAFEYQELPKRYFIFEDTVSSYRIINN